MFTFQRVKIFILRKLKNDVQRYTLLKRGTKKDGTVEAGFHYAVLTAKFQN